MTKIRLTRLGKHKAPFYRMIVSDSKARRDGPFIEIIGTYNPVTNPKQIKIDLNKAKYWIEKGAQPTDTARRLLKEAGLDAA